MIHPISKSSIANLTMLNLNQVSEIARARAIFELAVAQDPLDQPELVWKRFIDFEASVGTQENVRELYERLLTRTNHVKVWCAYAAFEQAKGETTQDHMVRH